MMMDSAILFTYTRAAPGREKKAFDVFAEAMAFFGTAAHEGKCAEPINFMGSTGLSLAVIPGEHHALSDLIHTDEFLDLYTKMIYAVPDIAYQLGSFGEGVQDQMARWARVGGELALI